MAEIKASYRLGAGELVVDLRDVKLPAGDRRVKIGMGTGHALLLVPDDVYVATKHAPPVGMGAVSVFGPRRTAASTSTGSDLRRAPAGTPRLVVEGDVGLGLLEVRHRRVDDEIRFGHDFDPDDLVERNDACLTRTASKASGASNG